MILLIEINAITENSLHEIDGWTVCAGMFVMISCSYYSHLDSLISYLLCIIYNLVRTYFWIPQTSMYIRFNIYFTSLFIIIYFYARLVHQRERDNFNKLKSQKQLIVLFHNLIKLYHDGIVISSGNGEIVLFNNQVLNIFDINQDFKQEYSRPKDNNRSNKILNFQAQSNLVQKSYLNSKK